MRAQPRAFVDALEPRDHGVVQRLGAHAPAEPTEEERRAFRGRSHLRDKRVARALVLAQRALRVPPHGNDPFLPPLPAHLHHAAQQIEIGTVHATEFGEAEPGGVEQFEDREVAHIGESPLQRARRRGRQQRLRLRAVEMPRQVALDLRRTHGTRRIGLHDVGPMQEPIKTPHRRERPRTGPTREPSTREMREPGAHSESIHPLPRDHGQAEVHADEVPKSRKVMCVRRDGVRRDVALLREMRQELGDMIIDVIGPRDGVRTHMHAPRGLSCRGAARPSRRSAPQGT